MSPTTLLQVRHRCPGMAAIATTLLRPEDRLGARFWASVVPGDVVRRLLLAIAPVLALFALSACARPGVQSAPADTEVTVTEGTSMAVAVSPDGRTLAIDLQGSIWLVPVEGGAARRITDPFNDARQPSWSPDGRTIAFQGFRDGTFNIWLVDPDGGNLRSVTSGPYDHREPAWSPDGSRLAFSSDRGGNGTYDVFTIDVRTGEIRQVTRDPANAFMPTWSPDGSQIAFASSRNGEQAIWAVPVAGGIERRISPGGVRADAPSWGPGGRVVYHASGEGAPGASRLEIDGVALTGDENVFPFRASWVSADEFFYTADGAVRRRLVSAGASRTVAFAAALPVGRARYTRTLRDPHSTAPRRALGIVRPQVSPDGGSVVFAALGDIWLMRMGEAPQNLTRDAFLDTDPAWSPDGTRIAYATDKGGGSLNLWVRDVGSGEERQITRLSSSAMAPAWSPDGSRIAFLHVDGIWRRANVSVVDVASGRTTQIHESMFGPGAPTWSGDGTRVLISALQPYSSRFREGLNQILSIPARPGAGQVRWHSPVQHVSIDSRVGAGPTVSPDGRMAALVYEGLLKVVSMSPSGEPIGEPRAITTEIAHAPSWTADSRGILYQANDRLRLVDVGSGTVRDVPLELTYTPRIPTGRKVIRNALLVDGVSPTARPGMDVVIEGNRIVAIDPHRPGAHADAETVDATGLTLMPGLIEYHTHLQDDFGEAQGRAWLAMGVTTARSPGTTPYEGVENREAVEAGVRLGPRVYTSGYLMEWQRVYYKMGVAVQNDAHLTRELERSRALQHDMVKSYVRMPDLQQRRIVEFAHRIGVPTSSHEVYPAAHLGADGVEHTGGTSRRGYSPKIGPQQRSYSDVAKLLGAANMTFTPTLGLSGAWLRASFEQDPAYRNDPRFGLLPDWLQASTLAPRPSGVPVSGAGGTGQMILDVHRAGGRVVAGTDTPVPANLPAELFGYVAAGMSPYEALRTATVTPAEALGLNAGSVEIGKVADLLVVEGNPLEDIQSARRIRTVIANGRVLPMTELLRGAELVNRP